MPEIVITDANWEIVTKVASPHLKEIAEMLSEKWDVKVLSGQDASYAKYASSFQEGITLLHSGVGHGAPPLYTGFRNTPILWVNTQTPYGTHTPLKKIRGAIHYLLSCLTGANLGPWLVNNGAIAYFGWSKEYRIMISNKEKPLEDPYVVSSIRNTGLSGIIPLADGMTVNEVKKLMIENFKNEIRRWRDTNPMLAALLAWNLKYFTVLGNGEARIIKKKNDNQDEPKSDESAEDSVHSFGFSGEVEIEVEEPEMEGVIEVGRFKIPIRLKLKWRNEKLKGEVEGKGYFNNAK